jgi:hypothetical protein
VRRITLVTPLVTVYLPGNIIDFCGGVTRDKKKGLTMGIHYVFYAFPMAIAFDSVYCINSIFPSELYLSTESYL